MNKPSIIQSQKLGKPIRNEGLLELGVPTPERILHAVDAGRLDAARDLVIYFAMEGKRLHDLLCDWIFASLDYVARTSGEESVHQAVRYAGERIRKPFVQHVKNLTVEERIYLQAEGMRSHRSGPGEKGCFNISEESDRYVLSFDPCGSGGRMRRTGELDELAPRTGPPCNFGSTSKGYSWSWGKAGVPYYCIHCCVWSEIQSIEWLGFPFRITDYNDDPLKPCRFLFYKSPDLIPDRYLHRIGKSREDLV